MSKTIPNTAKTTKKAAPVDLLDSVAPVTEDEELLEDDAPPAPKAKPAPKKAAPKAKPAPEPEEDDEEVDEDDLVDDEPVKPAKKAAPKKAPPPPPPKKAAPKAKPAPEPEVEDEEDDLLGEDEPKAKGKPVPKGKRAPSTPKDPTRYLAFRVQTGMRAPSYEPMTCTELAEKYEVEEDDMAAALGVLVEESRTKAKKVKRGTVYSRP